VYIFLPVAESQYIYSHGRGSPSGMRSLPVLGSRRGESESSSMSLESRWRQRKSVGEEFPVKRLYLERVETREGSGRCVIAGSPRVSPGGEWQSAGISRVVLLFQFGGTQAGAGRTLLWYIYCRHLKYIEKRSLAGSSPTGTAGRMQAQAVNQQVSS